MRKRDGFTLIELLVVIAIIAILAGILFPVFARARDKGRQAMCSSNMKQLGIGFQMYASDFNSRLPVPGGFERGLSGPAAVNAWYYTDSSTMRDVGGIWPYVRQRGNAGNSNVWSCPNATPGKTGDFSPGQNFVMNDYLRSFHPGQSNVNSVNNIGWIQGINPDTVGNPNGVSNVILIYEGVQYRDLDPNGGVGIFRNGSPFIGLTGNRRSLHPRIPSPAPQNYHAEKANFLYLDGHVKSMHPGATIRDTQQARQVMQSRNRELFTAAFTDPEYSEYKFSAGADQWDPGLPSVSYP